MGKYLPWEAPFDDSADRVHGGAHLLVGVRHSGRVRSIEKHGTLLDALPVVIACVRE
jgi:hypothetical protein